jgi:hypothetical protein
MKREKSERPTESQRKREEGEREFIYFRKRCDLKC